MHSVSLSPNPRPLRYGGWVPGPEGRPTLGSWPVSLWSREGLRHRDCAGAPSCRAVCLAPQVRCPGPIPACQTRHSPVPSVCRLWEAPQEGTAASWTCLPLPTRRLREGRLPRASPRCPRAPCLQQEDPCSARPGRNHRPPQRSGPRPPKKKTRVAMAPSRGAKNQEPVLPETAGAPRRRRDSKLKERLDSRAHFAKC